MTNEEAISVLQTWPVTGDTNHEALDMAIEALKSQQEGTTLANGSQGLVKDLVKRDSNLHSACTEVAQDVPGIHDGDMVSRQDAIESVCDEVCKCFDVSPTKGYEVAGDALDQLPSAEPEIRTDKRTKMHECDLISRRDAIDIVEKYFINTLKINPDVCTDGLRSLLSAEPERETGRWIHQAKFGRVECDQCGKVYRNAFAPKNYCPNCGAKMEGEG